MTAPTPRALKPNQQERAQRRTTIDTLLARALRGALTIPEAALLADYVRAEQRQADKTRESLAHTTRALQRHREAAATAILEAEQRAEQAEAALHQVLYVAEVIDANGIKWAADSIRRAATTKESTTP